MGHYCHTAHRGLSISPPATSETPSDTSSYLQISTTVCSIASSRFFVTSLLLLSLQTFLVNWLSSSPNSSSADPASPPTSTDLKGNDWNHLERLRLQGLLLLCKLLLLVVSAVEHCLLYQHNKQEAHTLYYLFVILYIFLSLSYAIIKTILKHCKGISFCFLKMNLLWCRLVEFFCQLQPTDTRWQQGFHKLYFPGFLNTRKIKFTGDFLTPLSRWRRWWRSKRPTSETDYFQWFVLYIFQMGVSWAWNLAESSKLL